MQAYDLIMLIVLAMATIFGAIKGFAWQVASIASVIVSYLVAYNFRHDVASMIQATPPWNLFLAMLLLYVGTSFAIWVGFRVFSGMIDRVRLKEFDRHLGAGFGFLRGLVYCLLITMFAMSLLGQNQQRAICQSKSGFFIASALDKGVGILPKEVHDVVGPYLANLDHKLKDGQSGVSAESAEWDTTSIAGGIDQLLPNGLPSLPGGIAETLQNFPTATNLRNSSGSNGDPQSPPNVPQPDYGGLYGGPNGGREMSGLAGQDSGAILPNAGSLPSTFTGTPFDAGGAGPNANSGIYPNASSTYPNANSSAYPNANPSAYPNANPSAYPNANPSAYPGNYPNTLRPTEQASQPSYVLPR